ncbi:MAG: hypothetical protein FD174_2031 [Geobacteraceae bacterium]|nr:MAG: hypothetical protein FD174_2031 [Geobacteraceae bacterium]
MLPEIYDYLAFTEEIAGLLAEKLANARTAADIGAIMGELTAYAEGELEKRLGPEETAHIACKGGCSACCTVNVAVLVPEAIAIAEFVRKTFSGRELTEIRAKVEWLADRVRWVDDDERIRLRINCAFLDERGWCAIHPVRPLLCRALTSTDPELCRRALASCAYDEEEPILQNLAHKLLMEGAFREIGKGVERLGMDYRSMELTRSVKTFLDRPPLVDDFLGRKRISFA